MHRQTLPLVVGLSSIPHIQRNPSSIFDILQYDKSLLERPTLEKTIFCGFNNGDIDI